MQEKTRMDKMGQENKTLKIKIRQDTIRHHWTGQDGTGRDRTGQDGTGRDMTVVYISYVFVIAAVLRR